MDLQRAARKQQVAVVGGGVVGMTTALRALQLFPELHVTLLTETLTPETTADGSAGLWEPYLLGDTPPHLLERWSLETYRYLLSLWQSADAADYGISLMPLVSVTRGPPKPPPSWGSSVLGFQQLDGHRLEALSEQHGQKYTSGFCYVSVAVEPTRWLPLLLGEFTRLGGRVRCPVRVESLASLQADFDAVANCTGLGARSLVGDLDLLPIRGQVARAEAPWVMEVFLDETENGNYIIPNTDTVVLGGTGQRGDWDCSIRPEDSRHVLEGCRRLLPGLRSAKILREWTGLRPGRSSVRLEAETLPGTNLKVVHNYGHGGSGVTLSWGCAGDAARLLGGLLGYNTSRL